LVEVRITDQAVSSAVGGSFEDAISLIRGRAEDYNRQLSDPGLSAEGRSALIDSIYRDVISYGIPETSFPEAGSPEEAGFRINVGDVVSWARSMRSETEDALAGIMEQAVNRVKMGTTPSISFNIGEFSEEQRDFASLVFEAFNNGRALEAPVDYAPGQPYSGSKRQYSEEDASSRRITAVIEFHGTTVDVKWPPWLLGQTTREYGFD